MKFWLTGLLLVPFLMAAKCNQTPVPPVPPPPAPPSGGVPNAPAQFIAFGSSTTTITLAWTAVKDATGYSLERKAGGTDAFVPVAQVDSQTTSLLDQNLNGNVIYTYRIHALNAQGASPATEQLAKTNADEPLRTQNEPPVGQPIQQVVGAQGGTISGLGGQITVRIPPGGVPDGTQITVQAFTNPVEENPAPGIEVSSSAPFAQPISVSFQYGDEDASNPKNLAMALQEPDGTWIARPYNLDEVARTITLTVPLTTLSQAGISAQAAPRKSAKVLPLKSTFIKPGKASVKPKGTLSLSAFGVFSDYPCDVPGLENQLVCTAVVLFINPNEAVRPVNREIKKLENNLPGWERYWTVNLKEPGNAEVGTVVKNGKFGAKYTAPNEKPSPDTVEVRFHSIKVSGSGRDAALPIPAKIKIAETVQTYTGPLKFNGFSGLLTWSGQGNLTWTLIENLPDDLNKYEVSGSVQATTTHPDCDPASASVPVQGTMIVFDSVRGGAGDPFASKYWFTLLPSSTVTVNTQCGSPRRSRQVAMYFSPTTACQEVPTLPTAPKYTDIEVLNTSGTWACQIITTTANWNFTASQ